MANLNFRRDNTLFSVIPSIQKYNSPDPILSNFEALNVEDPSKLGVWYNNSRLGKTSLMSFLVGKGYETTATGSAITVEEVDGTRKNRYDFPGLVKRTGNNFTLDIGLSTLPGVTGYLGVQAKPTDIKWVLPVLTEIVVFTSTGQQRNGTVQSVSADGRTLTALCGDIDGWGTQTTNLTVITLATRNGDKDCGDCFSVSSPSRQVVNYFNTSSHCYSYTPSQLLSNPTFLSYRNGRYIHNQNMDKAIADLYLNVDNSLLRSQNPMVGSADYLNNPKPRMAGMIEQLTTESNGATIMNDYITTMAELIQLNDVLDQRNAPDEYMFMCNTQQYNSLQNIAVLNGSVNVQMNPYGQLGKGNIEHLEWLNFKFIEVGGRKYHFTKWDALSQGTFSSAPALASNPTYILMPLGWRSIRTESDNQISDIPYVSLVWSGDSNLNRKLERKSDEGSTTCLESKVNYYSTYSLMVVGREHFIVGFPSGYNGYTVKV